MATAINRCLHFSLDHHLDRKRAMKKEEKLNRVQIERIISISEIENDRINLRKFLDNWFLVVVVAIAILTAKVAIEQLGMYARYKYIESQRTP